MSLLKEEGEDIGMKVIQLEERANKLENAMAEMSQETRAVLNDVRVVLTELENPMNYLKGLGIDEVMLTMAENITENKLKEFMEKRLEALVRTVVEGRLKETVNELIAKFMNEQVGGIIEGKVREMKEKGILNVPINVDELKAALDERLSEAIDLEELGKKIMKVMEEKFSDSIRSKIESDLKEGLLREVLSEIGREGTSAAPSRNQSREQVKGMPQQPFQAAGGVTMVGVTACASALVKMFGRRGAERVVDDNYRLGRISEETRSILIRAMSIIASSESPDAVQEKVAGTEEHMVVTYLFEKLSNGGTDMDFIIAMNLLGGNGRRASD
ncbi:MAG: hypothetical protein WHS82_03475 [Candidatus Methanosuratincola sp.]